ncbi:MAG: pyridoxamine 5'-phosphate oxidase [Nakamurella sp.]
MRVSYAGAGLSETDLAADWLTQFRRWFDQAVDAGLTEPNAMVLATASENGVPSSRTVLAKDVDEAGVTFYTNYTSAKSADLLRNPVASLTFPWIDLQRQVHFRGPVVQVDRETTQAYWQTRPRGSQLGAWASPQSSVLGSFPAGSAPPESPRQRLADAEAELAAHFGGGADAVDAPPVPVPPHWGGWRVVPDSVEFWQGRLGRVHDRLRFRHTDGGWIVERLAP